MGGGDGLFIDFVDQSVVVVDTNTPSKNFRGVPASKMTFTRSSTASRFNASGVLETLASDVPRFDFNPTTLAARGLLIEGARQNLLLNSDTLSTQSVTVTAAAHTLSFYGTGSVTLSGTSTGTINGAGAYPSQVTSTFTPTAGTLTLTVSGSVQFAQLELGVIASSYVPNAGTANTRAVEACSISSSAFPAPGTGPYTVFVKGIMPPSNTGDVGRHLFGLSDGTSAERRYVQRTAVSNVTGFNITGNANNLSLTAITVTALTAFKAAIRFQSNNINLAINGALSGADDTVCAEPLTPSVLALGNSVTTGSGYWHGWIQQIAVVPVARSNAQLQTLTA